MLKKDHGYINIFKTTFLFGFVQVFNIIVKVGTNKAVALFLGAEGMGVIGIFNSAVSMLKTGAGLGVSQSAVRDISEAKEANVTEKFSRTINITNKVIIFTSLLGVFLTILLSPYLSQWTFHDELYTISYCWLSIVVGVNILTDGQLAILKGMRQLTALAKASMIGSVVGLVSAVPFYYFFGKNGIIPSLIVTAFSALFFSNIYVRKINYTKIKLSVKDVCKGSSSMVKMGIALMLVSFLGFLFDLIVSSIINNNGGLNDVGFYHAGATIIKGYFGIVITAMSTDYYPRISAIYENNTKLADEMNKQAETGLIMMYPLVILFVFLAPYFVRFLYSSDFLNTTLYTDYAIIGTVIIVVSNCMGMILLAKQASKIFIISVLFQRVLLVGVYYYGYKFYGLIGLGLSYIFTAILHILIMTFILRRAYEIRLHHRVLSLLILVIVSTLLAIVFRQIDVIYIQYMLGFLLFVFSLFYANKYLKSNMGINLLDIVKNKLRK